MCGALGYSPWSPTYNMSLSNSMIHPATVEWSRSCTVCAWDSIWYKEQSQEHKITTVCTVFLHLFYMYLSLFAWHVLEMIQARCPQKRGNSSSRGEGCGGGRGGGVLANPLVEGLKQRQRGGGVGGGPRKGKRREKLLSKKT